MEQSSSKATHLQSLLPPLPLFLKSSISLFVCLFGWLVGFLTSSSTTRLYRGQVPRLTSDNFTCCHTRDRVGETMTSVSVGHIILTLTQPVGNERPQRVSNPGPPHQESRALPSELPRPLFVSSFVLLTLSCRKWVSCPGIYRFRSG